MDEQIRKAEYAGLYYPSSAEELNKQLDLAMAEVSTLGPDYSELGIAAMVVPCGGYTYTAKTSAAAFQKMMGREYQRVIVIGTSHFISMNGLGITEKTAYQSPLGEVQIDLDFVEKLKSDFNFSVNEMAFVKEYSIELQIPFLQKYLKGFKLVPIIMGSKVNYADVAARLADLIDDQTLIVVSTNFSHYLSDEKARTVDQTTINQVLAKDTSSLLAEGQASALSGLALLNELALMKEWQPAFLKYQNTSENGGDKDSVVGFASFVYFSQ